MKGTRLATLCLVALGLAVGLIPVWPSTAAAQKVEATLASVNSAAYINPRMQMLFIQKVAEKTNGQLAIKWVGSGQLGGLKENLEAVIAGNLEMCGVNNANLAPLYPNTMLFDFPFIFRDYDHMKKVVRGSIGQQVYSDLEQKTGIKLIMTGLPDGARSIWNRRRPVLSPDDVKGLKLRVMEAPLMVRFGRWAPSRRPCPRPRSTWPPSRGSSTAPSGARLASSSRSRTRPRSTTR